MVTSPTNEPAEVGIAELAYRRIRQAIVEGRYLPGQRLVEQRICEEFDLSRTPVRESLRRLEAEGLVHTERNRGAIVRPVTESDILDLYELRASLEALAARRAATRAEPADIDELDAGIQAFNEALEKCGVPDIEIVRQIDAANQHFHDTILRIAAHPRLGRILAKAVDLPLVFQAMRIFTPTRRAQSNLFHQLIRDAIANREPERAERLMTEHILMGRDELVAHLGEQTGGFEAALFSEAAWRPVT